MIYLGPSPSPPPKKSNVTSFFAAQADFCMDDEIQETTPTNADDEINAYLKLKCIPLKEDPLKFWKSHIASFPQLAKLAQRYLSAPATSYASEQMFSVARSIYDYTRSRLSPENAEMLLLLNRALPQIDFSY